MILESEKIMSYHKTKIEIVVFGAQTARYTGPTLGTTRARSTDEIVFFVPLELSPYYFLKFVSTPRRNYGLSKRGVDGALEHWSRGR